MTNTATERSEDAVKRTPIFRSLIPRTLAESELYSGKHLFSKIIKFGRDLKLSLSSLDGGIISVSFPGSPKFHVSSVALNTVLNAFFQTLHRFLVHRFGPGSLKIENVSII